MTTAVHVTAHYVYGVVAGASELTPMTRGGVDPAFPPELLREGQLAAITSRVVVDDEAPEPTTEAVVSRALAHEAVLEHVLDAGAAVVPFRFGATYADAEAVRLLLRERAQELADALARVDGRVELGVKAYVDEARIAAAAREREPRIALLERDLVGASAGVAHLRGKQLERLRADVEAEVRAELALYLHERLFGAAIESVASPVRAGILNGAYLVARDAEYGFRAAAASAAAEEALDIDVTGPWPAYHFVAREQDGER